MIELFQLSCKESRLFHVLHFQGGEPFAPLYEDITPVPSESELTPATSFAEEQGSGKPKKIHSTISFLTPSPRKLEAIALLSARFNLIHPSEINSSPSPASKVVDESLNNRKVLGKPLLTVEVSHDTSYNTQAQLEAPIAQTSESEVVEDSNNGKLNPAGSVIEDDSARKVRTDPVPFGANNAVPKAKEKNIPGR